MNVGAVNSAATTFKDTSDHAKATISGIKNDFSGSAAGRNYVDVGNKIHDRIKTYADVLSNWTTSAAACSDALTHSAAAVSATDEWTKVNIQQATLQKGQP